MFFSYCQACSVLSSKQIKLNRDKSFFNAVLKNFPSTLAALTNKGKFVIVVKDSKEGLARNSESQDSALSKINDSYNAQVSKEIEGRLTNQFSQEFSRTELQILSALIKLD